MRLKGKAIGILIGSGYEDLETIVLGFSKLSV